MMRDVWKRRWGVLILAVMAATRLSAQAQEDILGNVTPTSGLIPIKPGAHAQKDSAIPNGGGTTFLTLLLANSLKEPPQTVSTAIRIKLAEPSQAASPKPMTMLAISCYDRDTTPSSSQSFSVLCRTEGNLSNATPAGRIVMKGLVTQDVVSNGKILIGAGSKVSGIGHVDPDSGRVEAKGDWSIVTENQEIRVHGEAQDNSSPVCRPTFRWPKGASRCTGSGRYRLGDR